MQVSCTLNDVKYHEMIVFVPKYSYFGSEFLNGEHEDGCDDKFLIQTVPISQADFLELQKYEDDLNELIPQVGKVLDDAPKAAKKAMKLMVDLVFPHVGSYPISLK